MDDDWDLHAVVRGFTGAAGTTINTANNNHYPSNFSSNFPNYNNENHSSFNFPSLVDERNVDSFQGLHEIYQTLCVDPPPQAAATMSTPVTQVFQPQYEMVNMQQPTQMNYQMQENVQLMNPRLISAPVISYPVTNSQPIRPRRRKSQQTKMVHQVTEEELSADSWAWRKYGQKRIKGSPYPRNYYRCSTSKGCAARKHVERSPNDPNIFLVTFTGEHTHPRPSNRSSVAGTARNKLTAAKNNNNNNNNSVNDSSSPPVSNSSSTPLMDDETIAAQNNDNVQMVVEEQDTNIMNNIPNDNNYMYDENMLNGFHQDLLASSSMWNSTTF